MNTDDVDELITEIGTQAARERRWSRTMLGVLVIVVAVSIAASLINTRRYTVRIDQQTKTIAEQRSDLRSLTTSVGDLTEVVSNRPVAIAYLNCFAAYIVALIDTHGVVSPTPDQLVEIARTRTLFDEARSADLAAGGRIPQCGPPPR